MPGAPSTERHGAAADEFEDTYVQPEAIAMRYSSPAPRSSPVVNIRRSCVTTTSSAA